MSSDQEVFKRIFELDKHAIPIMNEDPVTIEDVSNLPIKIEDKSLAKISSKTISFKYFNSFNFSKLAGLFSHSKMTIGVTSANNGDGKTLVASNMAVSLASGYQQKTLLIDMNFNRPSLHEVFGTAASPGLAEAILFQKIRVIPTSIDNLYLMTAGDVESLTPGIQHTIILRKILFALKHKFDFVIIDMSSILPISDFPIHFINEIDGLVNVINNERTKKGDLKEIYKHLDESQFIAYVFNKVKPK